MKTRLLVLFFSIITMFVSGCATYDVRPMVVGAPVPPGTQGFANQRARDISPMNRHVGQLSFIGVSDTVKVINNSRYLICIAEGPVWIYPNSEPFIVSLNRIAQSYYSQSTSITIQVFDPASKQQVTTLVSPNYYLTPVSAYSQVREYKLEIRDTTTKSGGVQIVSNGW